LKGTEKRKKEGRKHSQKSCSFKSTEITELIKVIKNTQASCNLNFLLEFSLELPRVELFAKK